MAKVLITPTFEEVDVPVGELEVDPGIQRDRMDLGKVRRIKTHLNPAALGVVTVSHRRTANGTSLAKIVIDGWHRLQAIKELTDNTGTIRCHVFVDLTPEQEAQMFLDLNAGNQPNILTKFKVRLVAKDEVAVEIDKLTKAYGLVIQPGIAESTIQCIGALERVYKKSIQEEREPNILQLTLAAITNAWGKDRFGLQAVMIEGIAAFLAEYGDRIEFDRLVHRLKSYEGGAMTLHSSASQYAANRNGRVTMAVADLVTDNYNKGLGPQKRLPAWRHR